MLDSAELWVFHNAKADLQKLILDGVVDRDRLSVERIHDTECMAALLDEHRRKTLESLAENILGETSDETEVLKKVRSKLKLKKGDGYDLLPREVLIPYSVKDAENTLRLYEVFSPLLQRHEDLVDLYLAELELLLVVLDVEAAGMRIDLDYLGTTTKEVNTELLFAETEIERLTTLKVFTPEKSGQKTPEGMINLNSSEQILEALQGRGINLPNTQADTLKTVEDLFIDRILDYRSNKKIRDYLYAIERERRGDRIHPNYNLFKPRTGRMSSSKVEE